MKRYFLFLALFSGTISIISAPAFAGLSHSHTSTDESPSAQDSCEDGPEQAVQSLHSHAPKLNTPAQREQEIKLSQIKQSIARLVSRRDREIEALVEKLHIARTWERHPIADRIDYLRDDFNQRIAELRDRADAISTRTAASDCGRQSELIC